MHEGQKKEAAIVKARAQIAMERALPRGAKYVSVINAGGFNTFATNMEAPDAIEFMRGLIQALERDRMMSGK